ncbi:MAG: dihydrofolate reductase [Acidobacteria bacterium]|nr:dihydrofolate reductase [Acidobacteriota bacterium]
MIVSIIVAMDRNRGIGIENRLPWRLSADLKRFRELTMGHHIIVGRKTYQSIGKPLPGRQMIVVTRDPGYQAEGCIIVHSLDEAFEMAAARGESEVFVCGGADIYRESLGKAHRLYLTQVDAEVDADTFFPEIDWTQWIGNESISHGGGRQEPIPFVFKFLISKIIKSQLLSPSSTEL